MIFNERCAHQHHEQCSLPVVTAKCCLREDMTRLVQELKKPRESFVSLMLPQQGLKTLPLPTILLMLARTLFLSITALRWVELHFCSYSICIKY
jgi:hypothetical protein